MLSMLSSSCQSERRLREEPRLLRRRGSMDSARPSRRSELGVSGGRDLFESERSLPAAPPSRLSKSRSRSASEGTWGSEGPRSPCGSPSAERGLAVAAVEGRRAR